jgi:phosphohistidine swiveling domain-containing protein
MSAHIERLLEKKSCEIPSDEYNALLKYSTTPSGIASILKLDQELKELKSNHCDKKLDELCQKYKWISCLDVHYEPWTKENVIEYYESSHHSDEDSISNVNFDSILNKEEKGLVELNRNLTYYKELRDEYRRIGICRAQPMLREIGRRAGLTLKEVSYLKRSEIQDFLLDWKIPDKEKITQRLDGFLVYRKQGEVVCVWGSDIDECAKSLGFNKNAHESQEIKGKIASRGKVKGIAKIVLNEKDLIKVEKGDILVALTTGPSHVPAMAKAAAFVTDQGGITCHAAIVAREMEKPCIVGSQNATKVIEDGDLIEVDAEKGIVCKVER